MTWVLTNYSNAVCLLQEVRAPGKKTPGYDASCMPLAKTLEGWLMATLSDLPGQDGTAIEGVVPDGVKSVGLDDESGSVFRQVAVESNSYSVTTTDAHAVVFYLRGKRYVVPLPQAPSALQG